MHCVPGDLFDSGNGGLVQALHSEAGDFLKGGATLLESIRCPFVEQNVFPQVGHW
jgi:hypothetical protein